VILVLEMGGFLATEVTVVGVSPAPRSGLGVRMVVSVGASGWRVNHPPYGLL